MSVNFIKRFLNVVEDNSENKQSLPTFMEKCDGCIALRPVFSVEMS